MKKNEIEEVKNEKLRASPPRFYNVWVCYDGVAKVIEVNIDEQAKRDNPTLPRPPSLVLRSKVNLREHLNQESYFGFSTSTRSKYQLNGFVVETHFSEVPLLRRAIRAINRQVKENFSFVPFGIASSEQCRPCCHLKIKNLKELVLDDIETSITSLSAIASGFVKLERLVLAHSERIIVDLEVCSIAKKCVGLKKLCINGCFRVSDEGIEAFGSGCPNSVELSIKNCRDVSGEVADWLRERMPSLAVKLDIEPDEIDNEEDRVFSD
nr:F-box protein SKIP2-like [Ipomoea batatas]